MVPEGGTYLEFDAAVMRYKQGRCPGCGRGLGEPRGLEYRRRSGDLYCHTCKRPWPIELNATVLRDEVPLLESPPDAAILSVATPELSLPQGVDAHTLPGLVGRLRSLFKGVLPRHRPV